MSCSCGAWWQRRFARGGRAARALRHRLQVPPGPSCRRLRRRAHDDGRARMIQEEAKSKVPALGYGMPYAIGNTLLTIFGMVIVLMLAGGPDRQRLRRKGHRHGHSQAARIRGPEPFEIKDFLAKAASKTASASAVAYLNAGRGNTRTGLPPNRARRSSCWSVRHRREQARDGLPPASAACRRRRASRGGCPRGSGSTRKCRVPASSARCALGRAEVRLRRRQVRARTGDSIIGDNYPVPTHAGAQRADRARVPAVGVCGLPRPKGQLTSCTPSRAARRRCATSSSPMKTPTAC